jgi:hypothetical protein
MIDVGQQRADGGLAEAKRGEVGRPRCGATSPSAFGASTGWRSRSSIASGSRDRLSGLATSPLPFAAAASSRSSSRSRMRALSATRRRKASG